MIGEEGRSNYTLGLYLPYKRNRRLRRLVRSVMSIGYLPSALVRMNFHSLRLDQQTRVISRQYPVARLLCKKIEIDKI